MKKGVIIGTMIALFLAFGGSRELFFALITHFFLNPI